MTVKELKERLAEFDDSLYVVVQDCQIDGVHGYTDVDCLEMEDDWMWREEYRLPKRVVLRPT